MLCWRTPSPVAPPGRPGRSPEACCRDLHYLPAVLWVKLQGLPALPAAFTLPWSLAGTAVTHSVVVWLLSASLLSWRPAGRLFLAGWATHIGSDYVTHQRFAPPFLWPLSTRPVPGPFDWLEPATARAIMWIALFVLLLLVAERLLHRRTA